MDFTWLGIQVCICWPHIPFLKKKEGSRDVNQNQSVSGVTTICLMQRDTSPSHSWSGCWLCPVECCPIHLQWLCKVDGYWGGNSNTLSYTSIQSIPHSECSVGDMSGEYAGHRRIWKCLCTDPCDIGPCIIMLKHEVMVADEWHVDFITVSLCIQIALDKIQLCSLSVPYFCPYHNPTGTMGHSSQRWNHQTAHPQDAIHAVCHLPSTVETGINPWREYFSSVTVAINFKTCRLVRSSTFLYILYFLHYNRSSFTFMAFSSTF